MSHEAQEYEVREWLGPVLDQWTRWLAAMEAVDAEG